MSHIKYKGVNKEVSSTLIDTLQYRCYLMRANSSQFIAVIDDEIDLAFLFRDALSQIKGIHVFAFSDPLLALEHFKLNYDTYSIVISDYRMPAKNGIELLSDVKDTNPTVKTILISAFNVKDEVFRKCKCVDKFLQKPITVSKLVEEVQLQLTKCT